jgi:hypothetical protein
LKLKLQDPEFKLEKDQGVHRLKGAFPGFLLICRYPDLLIAKAKYCLNAI